MRRQKPRRGRSVGGTLIMARWLKTDSHEDKDPEDENCLVFRQSKELVRRLRRPREAGCETTWGLLNLPRKNSNPPTEASA
jgi:hypothetical protein